ncbi:GNAT family N-acetyltransferase [uncultured Acetatifactor sp.]|uniref:GNAT family N-acetyltransferase n=1 Tax=uncultured Acetatifactor sp. TaxID=1671927 RepID=UPI00260A36FD|nr:GNAT family N-acetyltransferase [uncultured Acetatifactor sp.]
MMDEAYGNLNILFTSAGRRSYLVGYFKEALGHKGEVFVTNSSEISPAFQAADHCVVSPLIYSEEYIPFLLRYCMENDIKAIIPLFDIDLPVLARNKGRFLEEGIKVLVSNLEVTEICNDKWRAYQFLKEKGFHTPRTFIHMDDAVSAIKRGEVGYPLIVKPRWGMGSIAVYEADNEEELRILYRKSRRKIEETYLKYESRGAPEGAVLLQEKVEGQEYGLDVINDLDGNYQNTVCKLKYAMRAGETDCAVTVDNRSLCEMGEKLSRTLRQSGNLDVDVFMKDGEPCVLEMNARFGGGYPFSHMAGVNLPKAIINWLFGEPADSALFKYRVNVMSQKDINLVRVYPKMDVKVVMESDISRIHRAVLALEGQLSPSLRQRGVDIDAYVQKLGQYGRIWLLVDVNGDAVGALATYMNDMVHCTAYISFLVVDRRFRGLHFAERLLHAAETEFATAGMKQARLEVRKKNVQAIGFYRSFGYRLAGEASEDSCYMEKALDNGTM